VPGGSRHNDGALQLLNDGTDLSNIKSTDMHSATSVLKMYHDMAIADPANTTNTPEITTRADAQDEAERLNTRVQFITGVKEALAKIVTATFGRRITDPVLRTANGSDFKSINDWTAKALLEAVRQGADAPLQMIHMPRPSRFSISNSTSKPRSNKTMMPSTQRQVN
jgi:hypothetical protein